MTVKLEVDSKQLVQQLEGFVESLDELTAPSVLSQIARATFSITGERFMIAADNYARLNPKKMHHVYEWGKVGVATSRLFVLERSQILYGNLVVSGKFLPSRMPVPINPQLLQPGKTGKTVSSKNIFRNKADVMEAGTPVSFQAKRVLAFMGGSDIAFIAPGTQINILHPGGIQTKNAFASFMVEWYTKNGNVIMDASGFYDRLANDVSLVLNSNAPSITKVRAAVTKIADEVDLGVVII